MIQQFNFPDWKNQWAGNWPILSFSYWGPFYSTGKFSEYVDKYVNRTIIIWRNGKSAAYQRKSEQAVFSKKLIEEIEKDENIIIKICQKLKEKTDIALGLVNKWFGKDITLEEYQEYQKALLAYYPYHIMTKVSVDFLSKELLDKYLPKLQEARLHAEPLFTKVIPFIRKLSEIHAKKIGYTAEMISAMTGKEFENYLQTGNLPSKEELIERYKASAFLLLEGETNIVTGEDINAVEKILTKDKLGNELKGKTAYRGFAKGIVKVIMDPNLAKSFHEGEILVAGMTRPEYVPYMEKAAAFVTDGGGILCHAAIVAREMEKPCVVGTGTATKVLQDGDLVEVNADKGIVKKLNGGTEKSKISGTIQK
jgi:phosphoenolpyruvate synthase/pyruvate phosphate dikinase